MAEIKETHVVSSQTEKSRVSPWLAFLVGALLIGVVAMFFMDTHGTISGPAGRINLNVKPPATAPASPAPTTPAPR